MGAEALQDFEVTVHVTTRVRVTTNVVTGADLLRQLPGFFEGVDLLNYGRFVRNLPFTVQNPELVDGDVITFEVRPAPERDEEAA